MNQHYSGLALRKREWNDTNRRVWDPGPGRDAVMQCTATPFLPVADTNDESLLTNVSGQIVRIRWLVKLRLENNTQTRYARRRRRPV